MAALPTGPEPRTRPDDPFATILEDIADARVDDAAATRERAGWAARRAEEDASLLGALVDLAERSATVRLRVRGGTEVRGAVLGVGADLVALACPTGRTFVRLRALVAVRPEHDRAFVPAASARPAPARARTMHDVACDATAERAAVHLVCDDGTELRGTMRAMGVDVLTLRDNSATAASVLVSFDTVAVMTLLDAP